MDQLNYINKKIYIRTYLLVKAQVK